MGSNGSGAGAAAGGGALYGLGIFGALVWFWQQAEGVWEHLFSLVQALFWPAYLVFDLFEVLNRAVPAG